MFEKTSDTVRLGVGTAFPGAAWAVGRGHSVLARGFSGRRQEEPFALDLTRDTLFDLASLSKLVSASAIALRFMDAGLISAGDRLGRFFGDAGNYGDCELGQLMTHTSGMSPGLPLYAPPYREKDPVRAILESEKSYETGTEVRYSCMGYIVLGRVLETVGAAPLDRLFRELVLEPLGMKTACYCPGKGRSPVAATERSKLTGEWVVGSVHDENAGYLGGVSGNAGLFASLDDMIAFAGMCSAGGLAPDGREFISRELFDLAVSDHTPGMAESRGLGFQLKGGSDFPMGGLLPRGSYGHTGFTGTSLYVDSQTGVWGLLLTNAVHYGRENRGPYFDVRRAFYDSMVTEFGSLDC